MPHSNARASRVGRGGGVFGRHQLASDIGVLQRDLGDPKPGGPLCVLLPKGFRQETKCVLTGCFYLILIFFN